METNVGFLIADANVELGFWTILLGLLSLPVLVVTNGYFVAAEFALVAVRKTRVEELVQRGIAGANRQMDDPLVTIPVGGEWPVIVGVNGAQRIRLRIGPDAQKNKR